MVETGVEAKTLATINAGGIGLAMVRVAVVGLGALPPRSGGASGSISPETRRPQTGEGRWPLACCWQP